MWRHPSDQAKALQGKGLVWLKQGARVLSPQRLVGQAPVLCNGNNHNLHFRAISCQPGAGTPWGRHLLPSSWGSSPDAPLQEPHSQRLFIHLQHLGATWTPPRAAPSGSSPTSPISLGGRSSCRDERLPGTCSAPLSHLTRSHEGMRHR